MKFINAAALLALAAGVYAQDSASSGSGSASISTSRPTGSLPSTGSVSSPTGSISTRSTSSVTGTAQNPGETDGEGGALSLALGNGYLVAGALAGVVALL